MFTFSLSFVGIFASLAYGLTINTPNNWKGNTTNVVTWTSTSSDPTIFTIELVNTQFNPSIGVANNVQTSLGSVGVPLPRLTAGPDFTLQFVDVSNINNVIAMSSPFSIAENDIDASTSSSGSTTISAASTTPGTPGGSPTLPTQSVTSSGTSGSPTSGTSSGTGGSTSTTPTGTDANAPSTTTGSAQHSSSLSLGLVGLVGFLFFAN